jgi:hypothetical protein
MAERKEKRAFPDFPTIAATAAAGGLTGLTERDNWHQRNSREKSLRR